jgi:hypothetical protein
MPVAKVIESQVLVQGDPAVSVNTDAPQDGAGGDPDETLDGAGGDPDASQDGEGGDPDASQDGAGGESDASQDGEGGESDASQDGAGGESDASQDGEGGESDASQDGEGGESDASQDGEGGESDAPPDGAGDDPDETQDGAGGDQDAPPDDASKVADASQGGGRPGEPAMSYVPDSQPPDSQAVLTNLVPTDADASQTDGAGAGSFVPETQPIPDPNAGAGQAASGVLRAVATGVDMAEVLQNLLKEPAVNAGDVAPHELVPCEGNQEDAKMTENTIFIVKEWGDWTQLEPFKGKLFRGPDIEFRAQDIAKVDLKDHLRTTLRWLKLDISRIDHNPDDMGYPVNVLLATTTLTVSKKRLNVYIWRQNKESKQLELMLHNQNAAASKTTVDILAVFDEHEQRNKYHYFLLHRESRAPPADGAAPA